MKVRKRTVEILTEGISLCILLLFVYAALSKLLDYQKFSTELGQSPLLTKISSVAAPVIIVSELLIAILISFKKSRRAALLMAFALMTLFTSYIIVVLNFSHYIPCSCGGILGKLGWTEHVVFNILFVLLSAAGFIMTTCLRLNLK